MDLCVFKYSKYRLRTYLRENERQRLCLDAVTESPQLVEESAISAGFSRFEVGWSSGSRTRTAHEVGNTS